MSGDVINTKPTIETVLERINALGEKFDSRMDTLESRISTFEDRMIVLEGRISGLESEVAGIRNDLRTGLRMVERKIEVLNNNMLQMVAERKDLEERVENLESKAS